jgi:murein tripeptide amidase MpaA
MKTLFDLSTLLSDYYEDYKDTRIVNRRYKSKQILDILSEYAEKEGFDVRQEGVSHNNKAICSVRIGSGAKKVLLWSQMHGNEATATMAILDIFKFFEKNDNPFSGVADLLRNKLSLCFIPVLNPDGTDVFTRENALGLDINRDYLREQCAETKIFKKIKEEFNPSYCFNLHDQKNIYNVGYSSHPASISFLAPAFNEANSNSKNRKKAMQLIALMQSAIEDFLPEGVARYNDEFYPTSFGDNLQKEGRVTILIESGGYYGDAERQFQRKMNSIAILSALVAIAEKKYKRFSVKAYNKIAFNQQKMFDLLIRNIHFQKDGQQLLVDIGINRNETPDNKNSFTVESKIEAYGDLRNYFGYEEFNAENYHLEIEKIGQGTVANFRMRAPDKKLIIVENGFLMQ